MTDLAPVVVVIDDDASVRDALRDLFRAGRAAGHAVRIGAPQLLDTKRPDTPSCVVLDVRLPGQSGLDFQRELNERNIACLPETGHGDIPMSVHAMKAGAVEFLTKPFREHELW